VSGLKELLTAPYRETREGIRLRTRSRLEAALYFRRCDGVRQAACDRKRYRRRHSNRCRHWVHDASCSLAG
jgi:hypothetical protein